MGSSVQAEDDVVRLSLIGRIARRRWRLLVALAVVGAVLGYGASLLLSPGYAAASKVVLRDVASDEELLTEVQVAMSQIVLDRTAEAVGGVSGADLRGAVTATVLDGNVIEIRGVAGDPEGAVQLTDRATAEYIAFSTQIVNDAVSAATGILQERRTAVETRVEEITTRITELERSPVAAADTPEGALARAELARLGESLNDANVELEEIEGRTADSEAESAASRSAIGVLEPAVGRGAAEPSPVQLIVGGSLVFGLFGLFALVAAARTDRRLRSPDEIAAALGSPVLGRVNVFVDRAGSRRKGAGRPGLLSRLVGLLRDDGRWDAAPAASRGDQASEAVRYRRALSRLRRRSATHLRVLVVVAADDDVAHRAVAPLAAAAAADGRPVAVITDDAAFTETTQAALADGLRGGRLVTVRAGFGSPPSAPGTELTIVEVVAARPTVPDGNLVDGVLVVLAQGSRTAWELVGLAGACGDAGYPVLGALVVSPAVATPTVQDPRPTDVRPDPRSNGTMMAGSA